MECLKICFIILFYFDEIISTQHVMTSVGDTVTLPCTYPASKQTTTMCWGRDVCPPSQCKKAIIWTDGKKVTENISERYQLLGDIEEGNVSLTISRVNYSDAGTYCCRVEIPGIFNDQKMEITVQIKDVAKKTTTAMTPSFSLTEVAKNSSLPPEISLDNSSQIFKEEQKTSSEPIELNNNENNIPHIIGGILLPVACLLIISLLISRYIKVKKSKMHSTTSIFHIADVEHQANVNIYTIE